MSWVKNTLTSSIGQKIVMSLTGLFLITFLIVHLIGNIALLYQDGEAFNQYAYFMKHNPVIKIGEIVMFAGFLIHIIQGFLLMKKNSSARSQSYAVSSDNQKVKWTSKYMGPLGIIILVFLLLHLWDFFSFKYWRTLDIPNAEIEYVCESLKMLAEHHKEWSEDYEYIRTSNEFVHKQQAENASNDTPINTWFEL